MNRLLDLAITVGLIGLLLAGCGAFSPRPDQSRFYTLTAFSPVEEIATKAVSSPAGISIGIGSISLPGYLDRQEIVTRVAQNQIALSENDRWAEPSDENFARVLAQNLSALLRTERINLYSWPVDKSPTIRWKSKSFVSRPTPPGMFNC